MPLIYRTLPDQWKKAKPTLMGKTGVGEALADLTQFDMKKVTQPLIAKAWGTRLADAAKTLNTASDRAPIKSNAKTKKWVDDTVYALLKDIDTLAKMANGTLVYVPEHKEWVMGEVLKKQLGIKTGDDLKFVTKAWPKLSATTRAQIVKLAGG